MNKKVFSVIMASATALLAGIMITGNILGFKTYSSFLTTYFGMEGTTETNIDNNQYFPRILKSAEEASKKSAEICEQVEEEGAVLLTNHNNSLPLNKSSNVSVFSQSSVDFVIGSTGGSGEISASELTLQSALENVGINVNPTLINFYKSMNYHRKIGGLAQGTSKDPFLWSINEIPYSKYTDEVKNSYKNYNDAAIVVISRTGAENADLPTDMASADSRNKRGSTSILELDTDEKELLKNVTNNFDKVIVLLNTTNAFECGFLDDYDIDACLWVGGAGQYGLNAIARLLVGDSNPSGHLADTYAYDVFSSPAMQNWGNFAYVDDSGKETGHHYVTYAEGIYVGYKYYETRYEDKIMNQGNAGEYDYDSVVQFPFGYGLSYTEFTWSNFDYALDDKTINIKVTVTNTGEKAGKEVVQFYTQSPYTQYDIDNQIEKSAVNLMGFAKTDILDPNQSETVKISIPLERLKSYDANGLGTYLLEKGDYYFTVAENSHEAINNILKVKGYNVNGKENLCEKDTLEEIIYNKDTTTNTEIVNQFEDANGDKKYLSRHDWSSMNNNGLRDGTNENNRYDNDGYIYEQKITPELKETLEKTGYEAANAPEQEYSDPTFNANNKKVLIDMKGKEFNDPEWDPLLDQLRIKELEQMVTSSGHKTYAIPSVGKPYATDSDGTSAWKSFIGDGVNAGGMPNETVQASTFNTELEYEVGQIMGELALWAKVTASAQTTNLTGWYAPAMNLHRTPFGGRNFEYYSECPMLSGIIGSSVVKGATDKGVITYIKHFAFNEQETNRMTNNVTWSTEQALRETYLLPFEMSIKEGGSLGVMTAYPRVGTTWTGGSYALITNVLRKEWGFNGFVITDYMDGDYENCDQMLAAGGDAALCLEEQYVTTEGARAHTYLRNAAHHLLYSFVNSNGMNGIDANSLIVGGTPVYYRIMIFFNITFGTLILLTIFLTILGIIQQRKIKALSGGNSGNFNNDSELKNDNTVDNKSKTSKELTEKQIQKQVALPLKIKIIIGGIVIAIIVSSGLILYFTREKSDSTTSTSHPEIVNPLDPNTDLMNKYGQITKKNLLSGSKFDQNNQKYMFFDDLSAGYYYEAEDATLSSKPQIQESLITSGGKFVSHYQVGETISFTIQSTVETSALLILSTACWDNSPRLISDLLFGQFGTNPNSLDFYMDFSDRTIQGQNDWNIFSESYICEVYLYEGENTIEFSAYEDLNLDYMCLVNPGAGLNLPSQENDPTDYNAKYGHPDKRILTKGTSTFSINERGYYYEAEEAELSSNIRIDNNGAASGQKNISYFNPGEYMKLVITSDDDASVMLSVSASEYNSKDFLVENVLMVKYGNDENNLTELDTYQNIIHTTGGWNNFSESIIGEIHLKKGQNIIYLISKAALNYDYITLVNVWDGTPDPVLPPDEETPSSDINYEEKYGLPTKQVLSDGSAMKFDNSVRGYFYEAEQAYLSEGINISDNVAASGGKTIDHFQNGRYMEFTITSSIESDVLLLLSGAKYEKGDYSIGSIMNVTYHLEGEESKSLVPSPKPFSPIGDSWDTYKEFVAGEIHLKEGKNIIRITSTDIPVNYDYIMLASPYSGEEPEKDDYSNKYGNHEFSEYLNGTENMIFSNSACGYFYEAESDLVKKTGDIQNENVAEGVTASGNAFINRFRRNATMTLTITSEIESDVLVRFSGCTGSANEALPVASYILLSYGTTEDNLTKVDNSSLTFSSKGSWNKFTEFTIGEIHLKKGINYIVLTGIENNGVNCDYIALINPKNETEDTPAYPTLEEKYGDPNFSEYVLGTGDIDTSSRGYYYEAESDIISKNGDIQIENAAEGVNASGNAFINRFRRNATMTLKISVSEEMTMLVRFSGCIDKKVENLQVADYISVKYGTSLDSLLSSDNSSLLFSSLGDWNKFNEFSIGEIRLMPGDNYLVLTGVEYNGINCDYIALVNALNLVQ